MSHFLVLELDSAASRAEYQGIAPVPELLDAVSEARADGFHVLRFLCEDSVLLERFTKLDDGDLRAPPRSGCSRIPDRP